MGKARPIPAIGTRFGRLTVIANGIERNKHLASLCRCDCGKEVAFENYKLYTGKAKTCGCGRPSEIENAKPKVGERFGRLVVLDNNVSVECAHGKRRNGCLCKCDCGNEKIVLSNSLKTGNTTSCGCFHKEGVAKITYSHGGTHTKLYNTFLRMRGRCNNPNNKRYKDYGGRGISICKEWDKFEVFREWALSHGYKEGLSIERVDVDKGYCPENCTWIPMSEQSKNRRSCKAYKILHGATPFIPGKGTAKGVNK